MPWTLPRLRKSRAEHRRRAQTHEAVAKRRRKLGIKQRAIVRKRTRQIAALQHSDVRQKIVAEAQKAAANYRKNPGAYHYLAGGIANTLYLTPSPRNYRSDCSQFVAAVYKGAGAASPAAPLGWEWASTYSIVKSPHARVTTKPQPGDLGMYGSRTAPHHVELVVPGGFIGHGSPPIDGLTPGLPSFYLTFDFLD